MTEPYYDLDDDWSLIYASFQSQYGIRLSERLDDLSWREFASLINGLAGDTPLGRTVSIRAEKDPARIKDFTPEQKKMRNDYLRKRALKKPQTDVDTALEGFKQAFLGMAK